ncbi:hypothetical protein JB92DRAFT_2947816 [Gautieria morchelliformis]|nr:hypothetical protein JB92DRAFT_2947816 [Gautieria morchelliformis]
MPSKRGQIMSCGLRYERVITQDEIVESVVDSATSLLRWSIHRPKRGWYVRVRSLSFPPGTFIPLILPAPKPPPASVTVGTIPTIRTPEHLDGALTFSVRTSQPTPQKASPGEVRIHVNTHSYPPTPPVAPSPSSTQTLSVPSPHEIKAKLHAITPQSPTTVTHFVFYPSLPLPTSITLSPAPFAFFSHVLVGNMAVPLSTFMDHTPTSFVLTTGLLEINKGIERQLGVDPGFWVAVALAYLEFLTERDSFLAAANR